MGGRMSQRKGRSGEIEICRILQANGIPAAPGQAVSFGETPDIVGVDGIHAEIKRRENVNLSAALEQAQRDSERFGGLPCVFHRANRKPWTVSMPLDSWLQLYQQAQGCECGGSCCRQNE